MPRALGRRRSRARWLAVHRWLGLLVGGVLALTCLSGIAVSYWHEIERLLHPTFRPLPVKQDRLSLDVLAPRAAQACPSCGPITEIGPGSAADIVTVYFGPAPPGRVDTIVLDAPTGRVLERARGSDEPVSILYRFHSALFAGAVGGWIVGVLGLLLAASTVSGVWLWWPRSTQWRWAFTIRRPSRSVIGFVFDLHKVAGVLGAAALMTAALTGIALAYPTLTGEVLGSALGGAEPALPRLVTQQSKGTSHFERLVSLGQERFPLSQWTDLDLPASKEDPVVLTFKQMGEPTKYGDTKVWMDLASGRILDIRDGLHPPRAAGIQAYLKSLHSGTVFGELVRAFFAVAATVPTVLYGSGVWLWWRRQGRRAAGRFRILDGS